MARAPLSLCLEDLGEGRLHIAFPGKALEARTAYRMQVRDRAGERPQVRRFLSWLRSRIAESHAEIARRHEATGA